MQARGELTVFRKGKDLPKEDVGGEDALGWRNLLPTSTSPLLGSDEPATSFPLLEGKVCGSKLSWIFLFFHGKFPGSLSRNRAVDMS